MSILPQQKTHLGRVTAGDIEKVGSEYSNTAYPFPNQFTFSYVDFYRLGMHNRHEVYELDYDARPITLQDQIFTTTAWGLIESMAIYTLYAFAIENGNNAALTLLGSQSKQVTIQEKGLFSRVLGLNHINQGSNSRYWNSEQATQYRLPINYNWSVVVSRDLFHPS